MDWSLMGSGPGVRITAQYWLWGLGRSPPGGLLLPSVNRVRTPLRLLGGFGERTGVGHPWLKC